MATEVRAPVFPESIEEGTLMTWYKQPGEPVEVDEKLADIETDKIVLEVVATEAGVLEKVAKAEGDTVNSDEVIGILGSAGTAAPAAGPPAEPPAAKEEPAPAPAVAKPAPSAPAAPPPAPVADEPAAMPGASPAARKLILDHHLDPAAVQGSGRGGRISKSDVLEYLQQQEEKAAQQESIEAAPPKPVPTPAATAAAPVPRAAMPAPGGFKDRHEERVPMTRIRARIAERLVEAQQSAAILTTFNEVNMKPVMDLRARYKKEFEDKHGVRLGFMSFFVKASVEALKRFPEVNASIDEHDIVYHGYYDIGIAVSSPRGLVVPVLRNADHMSFAEIESAVRDLGTRAQENRLTLDELAGGTFSLSNGGVFGSMLSTPILKTPQSAILGMHAITERPIAEDGHVVIRPVMYLALSYDHRLVDGREAIQFLVTIKEALEDPTRLLLEV